MNDDTNAPIARAHNGLLSGVLLLCGATTGAVSGLTSTVLGVSEAGVGSCARKRLGAGFLGIVNEYPKSACPPLQTSEQESAGLHFIVGGDVFIRFQLMGLGLRKHKHASVCAGSFVGARRPGSQEKDGGSKLTRPESDINYIQSKTI